MVVSEVDEKFVFPRDLVHLTQSCDCKLCGMIRQPALHQRLIRQPVGERVVR